MSLHLLDTSWTSEYRRLGRDLDPRRVLRSLPMKRSLSAVETIGVQHIILQASPHFQAFFFLANRAHSSSGDRLEVQGERVSSVLPGTPLTQWLTRREDVMQIHLRAEIGKFRQFSIGLLLETITQRKTFHLVCGCCKYPNITQGSCLSPIPLHCIPSAKEVLP